MAAPKPNWWKTGTAYQVWPASYKDSNGDGIGDIPGLISTLDYLKSLGIDIVWLSPMYESPQKDYGYDISNYEDVYPPFGTLADMDLLLKEVHSRGMKLILDLVINHTSDLHPWFKESRKSKDNEYSDWYIWKDPKIDAAGKRHPPNNWRSIFGGSAWEYAPEREQYYLHLFVTEQPDLNWENETVRKGIYRSAIEFWLDRGLDGFRVDTVNLYSKDTSYPDAEIILVGEEYQPAFEHFVNGPRMHEWLKEIRRDVLDKYGDVVMVGELAGADAAQLLEYVSAEAKELSCTFDFDVVSLGGRHAGGIKKHQTYHHTLPEFKRAFQKTQDLVNDTDAWVTVFLENHDQGRSLSRFATDKPEYREKAAKLLALLLGSLTGTLFLYQGQEIGMVNFPTSWGPEELRDIDSLTFYNEMKATHCDEPLWMKKAMNGIQRVGRDNARTPVQWSAEAHGGFTSGTPWIRVHDNYPEVNIAAQLKDPKSPLAFWKKMIKTRHEHADLLVHGEFYVHDVNDLEVFTFIKEAKGGNGKAALVYLNFSDEEQPMSTPSRLVGRKMELLVANVEEADVGKYLSPWEARLYLVE